MTGIYSAGEVLGEKEGESITRERAGFETSVDAAPPLAVLRP